MDKDTKQLQLKKVKIKAFKIVTEEINPQSIDFGTILKNALDKSNTVEERSSTMNENDQNKETYVISSYKENNQMLFGSLLRIKYGTNIPIPPEQIAKHMIEIEDLAPESKDQLQWLMENCFYFCLNNDIVVMNCGRSMKPFQVYANWILEKYLGISQMYRMDPILNDNDGISLSDVKNITIEDGYFNKVTKSNTNENQTFLNIIKNLKIDFVKELFKDTINISDDEFKNLVSAQIRLIIKKRGLPKDAEVASALKSVLKSVIPEDVKVQTTNHGIVSGEHFQASKEVEIATTENGLLYKEQLKQEMVSYINTLRETGK